MKHLLYGSILLTIAFLTIMIIVTLSGKQTRTEEVDSTLTMALEQSVDNIMSKKTYTINDVDEFVADVMQELLDTYENNSEFEIKVANMDKESGMVSLKVIEHFVHPNGNRGTYEAEKVVIMEEGYDDSPCGIVYYNAEGQIVIRYGITPGDKCAAPDKYENGYNAWKYSINDEEEVILTKEEIEEIIVTDSLEFQPAIKTEIN